MSIYFQDFVVNQPNLELIYEWRMDPSVRRFSFHQDVQNFDSFSAEFSKKFHPIASLPPQFILFEDEKVGVIYFEAWPLEKSCVLSIFLPDEFQGNRIGTKSIIGAVQQLKHRQFQLINAFVKVENTRARKSFENAGFELRGIVNVPIEESFQRAYKFEYLLEEKEEDLFIIAEAGSNYRMGNLKSDLNMAKLLIRKAYESHAHAVKFQLYQPEDVYVENAGSVGYLNTNINEIFRDYALCPSLVPKLYDYAQYLGIEFMCSFFSERDFEVINPYVRRHKIASYEIRHGRLIELAARSGKPLVLSCGASELEDIEWALSVFRESGGTDLTLLHCNACYPTPEDATNLKCIPELQKIFKVPVGYSDHSENPTLAPVIAASLGATVIEKHFTIHKELLGPDHFFAIDCKELKEMTRALRSTMKMLGVAKKTIFPQEEELAVFARRGIQAICPIKEGDLLKEGVNISILRSGKQLLGLHPKFICQIENKIATRDINNGAGLKKTDIEW